MYFRQKTKLFGLIFLIPIALSACIYFQGWFILLNALNGIESDLIKGIGLSIIGILIVVISVLVLLATVQMFPGIQIKEDGLKYVSFGLIGILHLFALKVYWSEIKEVIYLKGGIIALSVVKSGSPFVNGLFFNQLYGYLFKIKNPIILLYSGMEKKR